MRTPKGVDRVWPWVRVGGFAVLDQGLFAGTNVVVNVLLARWLPEDQYGAFSVAYAAFLLLGTAHTSLLTEPMLIFASGRYKDRFPTYLGALIGAHWLVTGGIAVVLGTTALVLAWAGVWMVAEAFAGLSLAAPFILLLWLLRRCFYARSAPHWAAMGSAAYAVLLLAGMPAVLTSGRSSAGTALGAMGLASLAVSVWLLGLLRPRWRAVGQEPGPRAVFATHWRYGRWSLPTTGLEWAPLGLQYLFLPGWVGIEGSAALRAVMNLIMPVVQANAAMSVAFLPAFVRTFREGGRESLNRLVRLALLLFVGSSVLYLSILWSFGGALMSWVYQGRYDGYAGALPLAALLPIVGAVVMVGGGAFRAMERPDRVFWCYVASSMASATGGLWLAASHGVLGATLAVLMANVIGAASLGVLYWVDLGRNSGTPSEFRGKM